MDDNMDQRFYTCWVLVERDIDAAEDLWVSHCLDLDIVSQGRSPKEAIDSVYEAMVIAVVDDLNDGLEPGDRPKAPADDWALLWKILERGKNVKISELARDARVVLATQVVVAVERINKKIDTEMPINLQDRMSFASDCIAA